MLRDTNRGYRAGKINDALDVIKNAGHNADYVALLDVDHRPAKDYITKCVAALEENDAAVSSGCFHFVTNKTNALTKVIEVEYNFYRDLYRFLSHFDSFLIFAGTGVLKGSVLDDEKFDEEASLDDFDLTTRMYLKGMVAVCADTTMGELAVTSLKDFYHQRVRWYRGAVESFSKYFMPIFKAPIPVSRKISWFCGAVSPFFAFLATPAVITYLDKIIQESNDLLEFIKISLGTIGYMWFLTACGIVAIVKHSASSTFEWKSSLRSEV
jgi:cellulose synthase/poly-beta-1,6-N-acetylglucosamine synthase-like glycosyltransferase